MEVIKFALGIINIVVCFSNNNTISCFTQEGVIFTALPFLPNAKGARMAREEGEGTSVSTGYVVMG